MCFNQADLDKQVQAFCERRKAEGMTRQSMDCISSSVGQLNRYLTVVDKSVDELDASDLDRWVNQLRDSGFAPNTVNNYIHQVRMFLRWQIAGRTSGPYPEPLNHLKVKRPNYLPRVMEHASISPTLYARMMDEARDHGSDFPVYLAMLYDTGARRGELLPLKRKNVIFNGSSTYLELRGKTGYRKTPLGLSLSFVKAHISTMSNDPEAYLFPGRFSGHASPKLFERPLRSIVKKLKAEGLIPQDQRVTAHSFRHNRVTIYATKHGMSNPMLETLFGWRKGSDMPSFYVHPEDSDVAKAVAVAQGLAVAEDDGASAEVLPCQNCEQAVPLAMSFCGHCGHAMQSDAQAEVDQVKGLVSELGADMVEKLVKQGMAMEEFINSTEYQAVRQQFKVEAI
jgi:site-specific recombinase XerD